jgi:hypothetical protein
MGYIGTGAIGSMVGYYVAAKELLGIQSGTKTPETETPPPETETPPPETETPPPETETPPPETETPPPETESLSFEDQFTTDNTGYDPAKWTAIKKKRFNGRKITAQRFYSVDRNSMKIAPQSYESLFLETNTTFSPPVKATIDILTASDAYGSGAHMGFALPGELYPGKKQDRQGRGSMWKFSTDSVFVGYNNGLSVTCQKDSPLHTKGDTGKNQTGAGSYTDPVNDITAELVWQPSAVRLSIGDKEFEVSENIPTDPMPFYLNAREWVGSDACSLTFANLTIENI